MAFIKKLIGLMFRMASRYPWVIPLFGFVSGVASFFLVERKQEQFGQLISALMLAGWVWIALENLVQRGISRWFGITLPPTVLRFVTQLIHQESLFFVIPFFFITTAWNSGQLVFTSLLIVAAFVSITDPIYYHWLAPRRWLYYCFHGITLFAALLTALPLIFHLPTPQSYLWSLGIAVLLTTPGLVRSMSVVWWRRASAIALLIAVTCAVGILVRPWIPPASIWLTQVAITDHIDDTSRSPNNKLKVITSEQLHQGVYAYTAIHAPRGLRERIYHAWYKDGKEFDKIALDISGGNDSGYRSWSHKKNFPQQATGQWQIRVVTEGKQVLGILRFQVVDALTTSEQKSASSKNEDTKKPAVLVPNIEKEKSVSSTSQDANESQPSSETQGETTSASPANLDANATP